MRNLGFAWGIGGVVLLLLFAIYRLLPLALDLVGTNMSTMHWLSLVFSILYMGYAEGYKGFHLAFAPRVIVRANYLKQNPRLTHVLLAPLFCMGFIYATTRRRLSSIALTCMIIVFIMIARLLPQPWRGILDAGVVVGLSLGIASIIYFLIALYNRPSLITVSAEIPAEA